MRASPLLLALALVFAAGCDDAVPGTSAPDVAAAGPASAATTTVVVTENDLATDFSDVIANPEKWVFYNDETDTIDNALGTFVSGPATAPLGSGSAEISVSGTERRNLATFQFSGTELDDITALGFSTFNPSAGNGGSASRAAFLNLGIDFDGSDTFQGRLVYVPRINGAVVQDTWQAWDAIDGGAALWGWSGYDANALEWPDGDPDRWRPWSEVLAAFPGIRIQPSIPFVGLRVGEPYNSGYTENLDAFVFNDTAWDFEPLIGPPTNKNDCKRGGWRDFNNPAFRNQGQCIRFVNTGR